MATIFAFAPPPGRRAVQLVQPFVRQVDNVDCLTFALTALTGDSLCPGNAIDPDNLAAVDLGVWAANRHRPARHVTAQAASASGGDGPPHIRELITSSVAGAMTSVTPGALQSLATVRSVDIEAWTLGPGRPVAIKNFMLHFRRVRYETVYME